MLVDKVFPVCWVVLTVGIVDAVKSTAGTQNTATNTAKAGSVLNNSSTFATSETTLDVGQYSIVFTISEDEFELELSHNNSGTLQKGIYNTSGGAERVENIAASDVDDYVQAFTVTAAWSATPTDAADVAYLKGATITGATLTPAGNVKLLASASAVTSVSDYGASAITITVDEDDVDDLTVTIANNIAALRIATNNPSGPEYNTAAEQAAGKTYGNTSANVNADASYALYHSNDGLTIPAVAQLTITHAV